MKNRFRQLVRKEKWTLIELAAYQDGEWWKRDKTEQEENIQKFEEVRDWCIATFKEDTYAFSLSSYHGNPRPGLKRFAFKNASDATMFVLKWK